MNPWQYTSIATVYLINLVPIFCSQKHCPDYLPSGKMMPRKTCYMDLRTDPPYCQPLEVYQFLMHTANPLDPEGTYAKHPVNSFAVGKFGPRREDRFLNWAKTWDDWIILYFNDLFFSSPCSRSWNETWIQQCYQPSFGIQNSKWARGFPSRLSVCHKIPIPIWYLVEGGGHNQFQSEWTEIQCRVD